jgi:glycosyltransferase involved in cell wall biosynthesis
MKTMALVTPWPPQQTGIADYSYDLATALSGTGIELVVYTTEKEPKPLGDTKIISIDESKSIDELNTYDRVIYQLGNNTDYHLWMIPLLKNYPGVVHIHDLVMHHIAAWLTWVQGDEEGYVQLLEKWYGLKGLSHGIKSLDTGNYLWDGVNIMEFPLYEEYAQYAQTIIVHSAFALNHIRHNLPDIPSFQAPQIYNTHAISEPRKELRKITILGGVDPQKRLDWVLEALSSRYHNHSLKSPLELHIVGSVDDRCEYLKALAQEISGPTLTIKFHGRVPESAFLDIFAQSDLCIALRYPTMGETSAIVMRALQLGIPTIVNDIGWYAELPGDIVEKLPVQDCAGLLGKQLNHLLNNKGSFEKWAESCHHYARTEFSLGEYGAYYKDLCENPLAIELLADIQAAAFADCGLTGVDEEDRLLQQTLNSSLI